MDDLISRRQAVDAINCDITITGRQNAELVAATIGAFVDRIKALPSAEPQERKGKWIYDGFDHPHGIEWCHCSRCGNQENVKSVYTQIDKYPYCAKCGARMEVDNE